jgi:putative FmdB family regulatory protein
MPLYEYKCEKNHFVEENRSINEPSSLEKCPECGENLKRVFSKPIINLVGRGFYRNGG